MISKKTRFLAHASIIAALYVVLTYLATLLGLSSNAVQIRFSEALTVLAAYTPAAIPGLFIGCFLSNIFAGGVVWDILFGSLATLLGALGTYALKKHKYLAPLPPIIANTLIVPFVLRYAYGAPGRIGYFMLTVGAGEVISCGILGILLITAVNKLENRINW
ncbi:QueT transporter family protein [Congzhengia sp.]|uniref:QueT transporter family protein n=1 Tax=Congzhengia sp. TaxID=2944168 RepID=UPI0030772D4E